MSSLAEAAAELIAKVTRVEGPVVAVLARFLAREKSAELLLAATNQTSIGQQLQAARNLPDARQLLALMIVIFVIGIVVDSLFGSLDRAVKQRWGLGGQL